MKALKNTKIINLEVCNGKGYFNIDCGRFGELVFDFDIDYNIDSDYDLESVTVELGFYDWELPDGGTLKPKFLNKRNTKMICEFIESKIMEDPEHFGFDKEYHIQKWDDIYSNNY